MAVSSSIYKRTMFDESTFWHSVFLIYPSRWLRTNRGRPTCDGLRAERWQVKICCSVDLRYHVSAQISCLFARPQMQEPYLLATSNCRPYPVIVPPSLRSPLRSQKCYYLCGYLIRCEAHECLHIIPPTPVSLKSLKADRQHVEASFVISHNSFPDNFVCRAYLTSHSKHHSYIDSLEHHEPRTRSVGRTCRLDLSSLAQSTIRRPLTWTQYFSIPRCIFLHHHSQGFPKFADDQCHGASVLCPRVRRRHRARKPPSWLRPAPRMEKYRRHFFVHQMENQLARGPIPW